MADRPGSDLRGRVRQLLAPGEIRLNGLIVHTEFGRDAESRMHRTTVEVGRTIASHVTDAETYVHSGNDDPEFGLNQHQGLTLDEDAFVWECQQLHRAGTYDIVFYYDAGADHEAILADLRAAGHEVVGVTDPT